MTAELPPRRPMPPEVRERLRRRVLGREVRGRGVPYRGVPSRGGLGRNARVVPLTAAATAAALALGGVVLTEVARDEGPAVRPTVTDAPPPTTSAPPTSGAPSLTGDVPTTEDLLRCGLTSARQVVVLPSSRLVVGDELCELSGPGVYRSPDRRAAVLLNGARIALLRPGLFVGVKSDNGASFLSARGARAVGADESTPLASVSGDGVFFVRALDFPVLRLTFDDGSTTPVSTS
uniref:hypothetical protein n=1 Tax=Actinosynnema sp. TaxID=1872144 RepID=UPI003F82BB65